MINLGGNRLFHFVYVFTVPQQLEILKEKFPFVSTFYDGCVDLARIDADGLLPIEKELALLSPVTNTFSGDELLALAGQLQVRNISLAMNILPLTKNPNSI